MPSLRALLGGYILFFIPYGSEISPVNNQDIPIGPTPFWLRHSYGSGAHLR